MDINKLRMIEGKEPFEEAKELTERILRKSHGDRAMAMTVCDLLITMVVSEIAPSKDWERVVGLHGANVRGLLREVGGAHGPKPEPEAVGSMQLGTARTGPDGKSEVSYIDEAELTFRLLSELSGLSLSAIPLGMPARQLLETLEQMVEEKGDKDRLEWIRICRIAAKTAMLFFVESVNQLAPPGEPIMTKVPGRKEAN